jgi:chromosome segregation ATPase
MNTDFDQIERLKKNIQTLEVFYQRLKQENETLRLEKKEVEKKTELLEYEISELKQHYETLKLAKTITSSSRDAHEAKIKINKMVRDIEMCIGLLNK